ncbi:aspartate/glutamate racemase family protein [Antarcticirhabdus aurantiaca]|uniref:Aspartate/glutamate racemase family protein n=1 Tax=Antarcticirhabdus aurantiaca TaxID=2606717 RepID=A0ACD4NPA2_9HYPH|nr:aspartate/glutamate racemase family protein [Antarcticirhabdus aurantiaca]WAJ28546.1 aspartate/glutamate racemase family protein [Jeongeuplla avenae]
MERIGLIGGMSWESTAVYYRRINEMVRERLGGLHSADIVMRSVDFHDIVELQKAGNWAEAGRRLATAARELEAAGARMIVICTNTMHRLADEVRAAVRVPLVHICDVTGEALVAAGRRRPLLLATRYTMEDGFWRDRLAARTGIRAVVPEAEADRAAVHDIIFGELCRGIVCPKSRERYRAIVAQAARAQGADSVILGCTEIGLLVGPADLCLPVFDSTLLHADAAVELSLGTEALALAG